jgi:hypothetical protein
VTGKREPKTSRRDTWCDDGYCCFNSHYYDSLIDVMTYSFMIYCILGFGVLTYYCMTCCNLSFLFCMV